MKKIVVLLLLIVVFTASLCAGNILIEENYFRNIITGFIPDTFNETSQIENFFVDKVFLGENFFKTKNKENIMLTFTTDTEKTTYYFNDINQLEAMYFENETDHIFYDFKEAKIYVFNSNNELIDLSDEATLVSNEYKRITEEYNGLATICNKETYSIENVSITNSKKHVYVLKSEETKTELTFDFETQIITGKYIDNNITLEFKTKDYSKLPDIINKTETTEVTE